MTIEDRIAALRQQKLEKPFCWLICFEARPLQGIPPGGSGPHLLVFTSAVKAQNFIKGRKKVYGSEPLSVLALDSARTLKELSSSTTEDSRYAPPPCGMVVDFEYPSGRSNQVLTPAQMKVISADELTNRFQIHAIPPLPAQRKVKFEWNRRSKAIVVGFSSVAALLIVFFILRGMFLGMKSGKIKPLSFMNTPTLTPTVTPTATATQKPWEVHFTEDFSLERNLWAWADDYYTEGCGTEYRGIENGAYFWTVDGTDGCVWRQFPNWQAVKDFEAYADMERLPESDEGDIGLVFRGVDDTHYMFFYINDHLKQFTVFGIDDDWTTLIDWTTSPAIVKDGLNRVGIVARGSIFSFMINGEKVATTNFSGISQGLVGLALGVHTSGDRVSARYDNFELNSNR
jgi:hypothetical protein